MGRLATASGPFPRRSGWTGRCTACRLQESQRRLRWEQLEEGVQGSLQQGGVQRAWTERHCACSPPAGCPSRGALAAPPGPLPTGTLWAGQLALSSAPLPGKKVRSCGVSLRAEIMRASGWI